MRAPREVRVALAGGASGGHLFPGLAVARTLAAPGGPRPVVYGSRKAAEAGWVGEEADRVALDAPAFPARGRDLPGFVLRLLRAVGVSLRELRARRPDVVVGLGGYASVPPGLAALVTRRPLLLLEQNVVPGKATRLLAGLGGRVAASYDRSLDYLPRRARSRARVVGNPVREELRSGRRDPARFGLSGDRPVLLVTGGSQGASGLNTRLLAAAPLLRERGVQVIHLAGTAEERRVRDGLRAAGVRAHVAAFAHEMGDVYATADLVLCRAGGTTLAELALLGKPSVLVPYPHHRDRHQEKNARLLADAGAARLVREEDLTPARFRTEVLDLIGDSERLREMGRAAVALSVPDAAGTVARWAAELIGARE